MKKILVFVLLCSVLFLTACQKKSSTYSRLSDDYLALKSKYDDFDKAFEEVLLDYNNSYKDLYNRHEKLLDDLGRIEDDIISLYVYFEDEGNYKDARDALTHLRSVLDKYY